MTDSFTITHDKEDEICLGERIEYVVTAVNWSPGDRATVQLRRSEDNQVYLTKTFSIAADETTKSFSDTYDLVTSKGLEKSPNFLFSDTSYHLYVFDPDNTSINATSDSFDVVLITPWFLRNVLMAGIPYKDFTNADLDDQVAYDQCKKAISEVEKELKIFFWPHTVIADPEDTETYDTRIDKLTWERKAMRGIGIIQLPHYWVQSINYLEGYLNESLAITIPSEWMTVQRKRGNIQIVPTSSTISTVTGTIGASLLMGGVAPVDIPKFWKISYVAGFDEYYEKIGQDIIMAIGLNATIFAANIIGDALSPGIASSSISVDGISESKSTTASAIYHLLSAKIKNANDILKPLMKDLIRRYRGPMFTVV